MQIEVIHSPILNINTPDIVVCMYTADWCGPCQRTKKTLFTGNANYTKEADFLRYNILSALTNDLKLRQKIFDKLKNLQENQKEMLKNLSLNLIEKLQFKKTDNISIEFLTLASKLLNENSSDENLMFLGFVIYFLNLNFVFSMINIDKHQDEVNQIGLSSIPYFYMYCKGELIEKSAGGITSVSVFFLDFLTPMILHHLNSTKL